MRAGDMRDSLADTTAARELIGYRPRVDLREGLRRMYEAFLKLPR
jgi:UDP-glucose 4-epimerase